MAYIPNFYATDMNALTDMDIGNYSGCHGTGTDDARNLITTDKVELFGNGKFTQDSTRTGWKILGREHGEGFKEMSPSEFIEHVRKHVENDVRPTCLELVDIDPARRKDADFADAYAAARRIPVEKFKGIFSPKFDAAVNTGAGLRYSIGQTIDSVIPFMEELEMAGVQKFKYNCIETEGNFKAGIWLDQWITPDDGNRCQLGFVFGNDHRGEGAVSWAGAGIREICGNFSMWGYLMGKASYRHTGDMKAKMGEFRTFLREIDFRGSKVMEMINAAHARPLDAEMAEKMLEAYESLPVGLREVAKVEFLSAKVYTYYGLYNALTYAYSHTESAKNPLKFTRMCDLSNVVESLLVDGGAMQMQKTVAKAKRAAVRLEQASKAAQAVQAKQAVQTIQQTQAGQ